MQQYAAIYLLQNHSIFTHIGTRPDLAKLEGSNCTDIMTCTRGCGYSF